MTHASIQINTLLSTHAQFPKTMCAKSHRCSFLAEVGASLATKHASQRERSGDLLPQNERKNQVLEHFLEHSPEHFLWVWLVALAPLQEVGQLRLTFVRPRSQWGSSFSLKAHVQLWYQISDCLARSGLWPCRCCSVKAAAFAVWRFRQQTDKKACPIHCKFKAGGRQHVKL